jgi:hypothetical protein
MKYFTLDELLKTQSGRNIAEQFNPPAKVVANLESLVKNILDPLREAYGKPIQITSGYRCERLNKIVKGAKTSQHLTGQAADIRAVDGNNKALFELCKSLPYDQLIWEYGTKTNPSWVHVSYSPRNRKQILFIPKNLQT